MVEQARLNPLSDSGSNPTPPLQVRLIDLATARTFIEKHHYSHKTPTGKNVFFGWFDGDTIYAVADFGIGVNAAQHEYLKKVTGKPVRGFRKNMQGNLFELKRLCRIGERGDKTRYPLTKFLSMCHKILKRDFGIRFIVSFSDPTYDHNGGIYKAANFEHLGKTNAEWHVVDKDGRVQHRRKAYRFMQRYNAAHKRPIQLAKAREILGLKRVVTLAKDRWFIDLGEK